MIWESKPRVDVQNKAGDFQANWNERTSSLLPTSARARVTMTVECAQIPTLVGASHYAR